ncbi:tRNA-(ms[2]io[6]A)-hydroxylase [Reinekea forsetii]|nr:tRNA-(ms[2]io[6]A)-hydroxylase [Reinekea forsetii]
MHKAEIDELLVDIRGFLACETPDGWVQAALSNLPTLLIDHANCEKKAASTAMSMMYKYIDRPELLAKMSKLAREELVHFDQVLKIMKQRDISYDHVPAGRYAATLFKMVVKEEPQLLIDKCILGAIVEARSCERFAKLVPHLDPELGKFYFSLLRSEARHYQHYINLAEKYADSPIDHRLNEFLQAEKELILSEDTEFRFHSGVPNAA